MKKIVLLLFVMLLLSCFTWAKPITLDQAKQVAGNIMVERSSFTNPTIVNNVIQRDQAGQPLIYIFNFRPASFVMVSAEDNVFPVLGYCFDQEYSEANHPIQFDDLLYSYRGQIQYAREHELEATAEIRNDWRRLNMSSATFVPLNIGDRDVAPILQATWGQDGYYAAYVPSGTPVGCVAVAMGQVMKRWSYPTTGTGSNSYSCPPYGTLSADFSATTYSWSLMPNALTSSNSYVAQLLYHLGVSVDMQYAPGGSGAYDTDARDALINNWGYKNTLSLVYKSGYTAANWDALMKTEIDAGRPMYYSGSGPEGGHAFNLDGYQGTAYPYSFHFNWGWYGYYNGYYLLSNLNPGGTTFNTGCAAIIGIQPGDAVAGSLSETFDTVTAPALPSGWTVNPASTWVTYATSPITTPNSAYYGATATGAVFSGKRLITPKLTVSAGNTISFYAKRGSSARGETVKVKYSADLLSWSDFSTPISQALTATATQYTFPIGNYHTGDYYLCFETYSATTTSNLKQIWLDTVVGPPLWINPSPVVSLNTNTWNAGNVAPGTVGSSGSVFSITNTGGSPLTVTSATITGTSATKFSSTFNTGTVLTYGQSYAFGFNYEPTTYTSDTATFTLVTNGGTVTVALSGTCQYNVLQDGFETYTDFAISFAPWTVSDGDLLNTYGMTGIDWLNSGDPQAYIIFNPSTTTPPLSGDVNAAHSGYKMACCFAGVPGSVSANNDWLITPQLTLTGTTTVNFYAKSYTADYGLERFKVLYSTTTNAVASFTNYLAGSASTYISAPTAWTFYSYTVPSTAKYIAIQCVSADAFIFMVDDFYVHDSSTPPAPPDYGNMTGYVYEYGTTNPIANALVTIGVKSATTNSLGAYTINNILTGTYTANCSAPGTFYFSTSQAGVVISANNTTTQNFGLKWASIAVTPTSVSQTLNPFATGDQTMTISNPTGTGDLTFGIYATDTSARHSQKPSFSSDGLKQRYAQVSAERINPPLTAVTNERSEGWADYTAGNDPDFYSWSGPERGTYFGLNDWGLFSNGITLTQLRHTFYENATSYPWGADSTFVFKIYASDLTTVLYTSPTLGAKKYPTVTTYTLPTPMTFTDDFMVVVRPTNTTTGFPSSLYTSAVSGNSVVTGETADWELLDGEWLTAAYIAGDEWAGLSSYSGTIAPAGSQAITVHFDAANLNGVTKTANVYIVNNSNYILPPRGDNYVVPLSLTVNSITTPIPILNTTTWRAITPSTVPYASGSVFTLTNAGIGTLTVSSITNLSATEFSTTFVPGAVSLANGQSYSFGFTYTPTTPGVDNVAFNIVTSNGTVTVQLKGYGDYTLEGFEGTNFPPDGWASIDQDADTYNWYAYSATGAPYEGLKCAASASYVAGKSGMNSHGNSRLALTPDNYLITPKLSINSGDVLEYYIAAQDPAWPAEYYSVKLSTTTPNAAGFTTTLFSETLVDGDWHVRTIDLSTYAHQDVYLAFEHYNCTDQFILKLDNVLYPILAAPLQYGSLKGNVFASGTINPIQNATVTINNLSAVTDIDGYFEIADILVGTYDAVCTPPTGSYYFGQTITGVVINADEPTSQDFELTWAELGVSPTSFDVTVGGGATADRNLTITNPGGTADLQYAIVLWDTSSREESLVMAQKRPAKNLTHAEKLPADRKIQPMNDRTFGWYGYGDTDDANYYTWEGTERATKYVLHDLGLLKPVTIQQVGSFFYNPSTTPWVDATFHFVIYGADGTTVLYTSADVEATSLSFVTHTLTTPLVVNSDFYVAAVPTDVSSSPFSLGTDLYTGNSYYKSSGVWTLSSLEYMNYVYAEGAGWLTLTNDAGTVAPAGSAIVGLHFDAAGLENTTRSCTMAIYNNSNNTTARGVTRQIPVTLTITAGGLDAPTGVTATLDGDNIVLNWTAVSGASSYKVYGSNDPNAADWGTAIGTVTSPTYTDTSGMLFRFYKITAVSGAKVNHEVPVGKPVSTRK